MSREFSSPERAMDFGFGVLDSMTIQISVVDGTDEVRFGNSAFFKLDCRFCRGCRNYCVECHNPGAEVPDNSPSVKEFWEGCRKVLKGEDDRFSLDFYCPKTRSWIRARATVFMYAHERLVVIVKEDITEQRRNEENLRKLSRAVEMSSSMIVITDISGNIEYVNAKFTEVTGYSSDEVKGKNPRLLKSNTFSRDDYKKLWETITAGREWRGEIRNKKKNGEHYWEFASISPVKSPEGKITNYIAVKEDITERKNTEIELQKAREREVEIASKIQQALLIGKPPAGIKGFDVFGIAIPSQKVDGDFIDFFRQREDCFDLILGDVMGKGIAAGLQGAGLKSSLFRVMWELIGSCPSNELFQPKDLVNRLSAEVSHHFSGFESYVTLCYTRFDFAEKTVTFVNCGNPPPIRLRPETGELDMLEGTGMPLGILDRITYLQTTLPFRPGDLFFLYSDGVTEARNAARGMFGTARLGENLLRNRAMDSRALIENLKIELEAFSGAGTFDDDVTCAAVRVLDVS